MPIGQLFGGFPIYGRTGLVATAATITADTTRYVVLNHGRPAGQMTVVRDGDSVIVHYRHVEKKKRHTSF